MKRLFTLLAFMVLASAAHAQTPINGNYNYTGTLSDTGNGTCVSPCLVDIKPGVSASILYAAPYGSDSNDGLTLGTPKQYIDTALCSLPGGSCTTPITVGAGTVIYANNTAANAIGGVGIWLAGPNDVNYSSLPTGWMRDPNGSTGVAIQGIPTQNFGPASTMPKAQVLGNVGVKLSAIQSAMWLVNMAITGPQIALQIGQCSDGTTRSNTCNSSEIHLKNWTGNLNNVSGSGPCMDITGASFEIYMFDIGCEGNTSASPTSDQAQAIMIDGRGNSGMGDITIDVNGVLGNGGIVMYPGVNILDNITVRDLTQEGSAAGAPVHIVNDGLTTFPLVHIENIQVADPTGTVPAVQVDPGLDGSGITVIGAASLGGLFPALNVSGPATVFSQYAPALFIQTVSPLSQGQGGYFFHHLVGQVDDLWRVFPPTAVRSANLASTSPSAWTATYGGAVSTITTGQSSPDGLTGAGLISYSSGSGSTSYAAFYIAGNVPLTLGDYYVWTTVIRSGTNNGYVSNNQPILFTLNGDGYGAGDLCNGSTSIQSLGNPLPYITGDGEFERVWGYCKVTANPTNGGIVLYAQVSSTQSLVVFAPTLIHIAAGTLSNNEVAGLASALLPYSNTCTVGQLCTPSGPVGSGISGLTAGVVPFATSPTAIGNSSPQLDIGVTHSAAETFLGSGGLFIPNGPITTNLTPGSATNSCILPSGQISITGCPTGAGTVTNTTGNLLQGEPVVGTGSTVHDIITTPQSYDCGQSTGSTADAKVTACEASAITAGVSNPTAASLNGSQTLAAQTNVGDTVPDAYTLTLPSFATWQTNSGFTGGTSCAIFQYSLTNILSNGPRLRMQIRNGSASGAVKSLYCNNGGGYYGLDNVTFYNPTVATNSNVTVNVSGAFDGSHFNNLDILGYADATAGLQLNNHVCCSATFFNDVVNMNYTGGVPYDSESTSSGTNNGVNTYSLSADHPTSATANIKVSDTSSAHNSFHNFFGTYGELGNVSTATSPVQIIGAGQTNFFGLLLKAEAASTTAAAISTTSAFASCLNTLGVGLVAGGGTWTLPGTIVSNGSTGNSFLSDSNGNSGLYTSCPSMIDAPLALTSYHDVKEIVAPSNPASGYERWYANSTTHTVSCLTSGGGNCATSGGTTITVASGTAALGTSAISSATCATVVTVTATGTLTTDDIMADFNGDPTSTTGYIPSTSGMLTIIKYPTAGNVNFKVCNNTSASITPGSITLNWRVVR